MRPDASSVERLTEAMARAQRHWHRRGKEAPAAATFPLKESAFTIALTREAGSPGTSVAREVGARLRWPVYDHELLERIAQEKGLRVDLLESIEERRRSWLQEGVEVFASVPSVSESTYLRHLIEAILFLGAHGECVIVGRGAAQILPRETTLRVRLVGLLEDRIAATSQRLGIPARQAAQQVEETDRERTRFIKYHFQKDPTDPRHYDLLLNTSSWSVPECAELIVEALRRLQSRSAGRGS